MGNTAEFNPQTQTLKGQHSIEASAGTGKTYSITLLWLRLILEEGLSVESILVSTFTKAATAELKDRLLATLKEARWQLAQDLGPSWESAVGKALTQAKAKHAFEDTDWQQKLDMAISSFDLAPIVTLHGFCERLMRQNSIELDCDPEVELMTDNPELIRRVVDDYLMQHSEYTELKHDKALEVAKILINEAAIGAENIHSLPAFDATSYQETLEHIRSEYDKNIKAWKTNPQKLLEKALQGEFNEALLTEDKKNYFDAMDTISPRIIEHLRMAARLAEANRVGGKDFIDHVRSAYPKAQAEMGVRGYVDILLKLQTALRDPSQRSSLSKAVANKYSAVIIDECQDSDAVQIDIFRRLFLNSGEEVHCFLVIGDPKQSIYRFRGADLYSYSELTSLCSKASEMKVNYRSDEALVNALNSLYGQDYKFDTPMEGQAIKYVQVGAKNKTRLMDSGVPEQPCFWMISDAMDRHHAERDLASKTALECRRLLSGSVQVEDRESKNMRPLQAKDIAILAYKSSQLQKVRQALLQEGIPCQMMGKGLGSVYDSDEVLDIQAWLDLLAQLENQRGHLLKPLLLFAATPLAADLLGQWELLQKDPQLVAERLEVFKRQLGLLHQVGPLPVLIRYINSTGVSESVLKHAGGERMLTNWRQLLQFLQNDWQAGHRTATSLATVLMRRRAEKKSQEEEMARLETDLSAVQLSTIHGSKGLEYPIVFCPFLWNVNSRISRKSKKVVAILRKGSKSSLDYNSPNMAINKEADLEQEDQEQQRLLYVALTRARHRLVLGFADVPTSKGNGHDNGTQHSALAKLLDHQLDGEAKGGALSQWPHLKPCLSKEPRVQSGSREVQPLFPLPVVDAYRGTIARQVSFSALIQLEHGLNPQKNRDEENHEPSSSLELSPPKPKDYGLIPASIKGGPALGNRIHDLLEQHLGNRVPLAQLFQDESNLNGEYKKMLEAMLAGSVPLGKYGSASSLIHFAQKSMAELHFIMPLAHCEPQKLSSLLLELELIQSKAQRVEWAKGVAQWSFSRVRGYLQGYIDLIVQFQERWYVVDYKTNLLSGYGGQECEDAMIHGHYFLQSLIYALALHRHLQVNDKNYQAENQFGGIAYLFVRGLRNGEGVWWDTPTVEDLTRLDLFFRKDH